ncbi:hypothetical protein LQ567_24315 [Niabella pedocola]|uniref:Uncharacterized protein n=1 Tax=Niabella pedocola TaxID=1752077 RepID=A0ABS8PY04_9BACT|nr:hypothetical protein [Niabella pedocola]MCD2425930.1 hypothetical protein [Niabella pedocola]
MVKENKVEEIFSGDLAPDLVYSIFDKWLSEEECAKELMSSFGVNSLEDYKGIKQIEDHYLNLFADLGTISALDYIDIDTERCRRRINFNFFFREISKHILLDERKLFFLTEWDMYCLLSFDFTVYIYANGSIAEPVDQKFKEHCFHSLPVLKAE